MPTLNKKLFARLLLGTVLLGAGLFGLHSLQSGRITQSLLWQSQRYADDNKPDLAAHYLRRYLEFRPDDVAAAVRLCDMLEKRGGRDSAGLLYLVEKILREDPNNETIRRKAVDVCLKAKRYSDAIVHAEKLLEARPTDAAVWQRVGLARVQLNKHEEARAAFEKSIALDPAGVETYGHLAELLMRQAFDMAAARATLDQMVAANPADHEAFLIRARFHVTQNSPAPARADLERLLRLDPENAEGLLMLADIYQSKGDLRAVRDLLTDGCALYARDVRMYRALSWLELTAGNRPASVACLERGIAELPLHADLLTPLGDLLVQDGELERVEGIIAKLNARRVAPAQGRYLAARVKMARAQYADAVSELDRLQADAVGLPGLAVQVNLLLAECHRHRADREAEVAALQRVLTQDANSVAAHIGLGTAHLNAGRYEDAVKEYGLVARSPYAPLAARVTLAQLRTGLARGTKAGEGEWESIAQSLESLRTRYPQSAEPAVAFADLLLARKKVDQAAEFLRAETASKPRDARIWAKLASVRERQFGSQAALETLDEAQAVLGDQVELRLTRAGVLARGLSPRRAELLKNLEGGIDAFNEGEQVRLLYGLAEVHAGTQDKVAVARVFRAIAARYPNDVPIRMALADAALAANDRPEAAKWAAEVEKLEGKRPRAAKLMEARALIAGVKQGDNGPLQKARELVQAVLLESPGRTDAMVMLARIAEAEGDVATARKQYAAAVEQDRSDLRNVRAQLEFLWGTNQDAATQKLLTEMVQDPRVSGDQFRQIVGAALVKLTDAQFRRGLVWVRGLTGADAASLVWLGDLYWAKGMGAEAGKLYDAAASVSPGHADAYVHRVCRLAERRMVDKIEPVLAKAKAALPPAGFFLLCAQAADLIHAQTGTAWAPTVGSAEERRAMVQANLTYYLSQNRRADAAGQLRGMAEATDGRPEDVDWAKRNLALLQAGDGSPDDRRKALTFLQKNPPRGGATPEDQRAQVAILALASRHFDAGERKLVLADAVVTLEKLLATPGAATSKDQYHLAQLQRLSGDRAGYRKSLAALVQREPEALTYRLALVEDLLSAGDLDAARPEVERLSATSGSDFRAVSMVARYHHLRGDVRAVLETAGRFIRDVEPGSNEAALRVRQSAELLDGLARATPAGQEASARLFAAAAIDKYAASLRSHPDSLVPLVTLLAFDNQPNRAFEMLTRLRHQLSARLQCSGGLALLRSGHATERQFQTVKEWIDNALSQHPSALALKLSLAEFHALRQDYPAAERVYANILEGDPANVVALNNLAWILAPRAEHSKRAMELVQRAIAVTGHTGELLDTRARIQIASGRYDRAVEDLGDALNQSETSLRYFHLAVAKLKQSQNDEADEAFGKARFHGLNQALIHPSDLPSYQVLAQRINR